MILKCIVFLQAILFIGILMFSYAVLKKYKKTKQDINKIYLAIKRLRYGDIHVRIENLNDKNVENAVNRLFETISDREMMIKEYQNTLSDKNLSLEKIIKQETQMQQIKEDFIATLTHDMKVPVIAQLNSVEYLLNERFGRISEKQTEVLKLMKESNIELKNLIENMLEIYKNEQNEIKLNIQEINLNDFLNAVISEMRPITAENEIKIILLADKTKYLKMKFDPFQIKRVIKNLIQNAVLHSPRNEKITVKTEIAEKEVTISVTNKGTGISKEDLELIFHKYYTGHSKFRKSGTGLGLYISKQIMLAHNGIIDVDTTKEGYTTFFVKLQIN